LQAVLAQWRANEGSDPEDGKWGPILAAAGYVLGRLLHAKTTDHSQAGARRLVALIEGYCGGYNTQWHLEALRGRRGLVYGQRDVDDIIDALLSLREERERRRKERHQQQSTPESEQGWDF
jgi:hypothetical protein